MRIFAFLSFFLLSVSSGLAGAQPKWDEFVRAYDRVLERIQQVNPRNASQLRGDLVQRRRATFSAMGRLERTEFYGFVDQQLTALRRIEETLSR